MHNSLSTKLMYAIVVGLFVKSKYFLLFFQGVVVLIDVETYEYFSVHSAGSEGVLVLIQHYRDIPLMRKESFVLSPGSMNNMKIAVYLLYQLLLFCLHFCFVFIRTRS